MSMAVGLGRNKSVVEHEKQQHKAKQTKIARDKKVADHKKRIAEAMGCRRQIDEIMLIMLICVYILVLGWSCAIYPKLVDSELQYDPANDAWYIHDCAAGIDTLKTWWRMNPVWTGSMVCLLSLINLFMLVGLFLYYKLKKKQTNKNRSVWLSLLKYFIIL